MDSENKNKTIGEAANGAVNNRGIGVTTSGNLQQTFECGVCGILTIKVRKCVECRQSDCNQYDCPDIAHLRQK